MPCVDTAHGAAAGGQGGPQQQLDASSGGQRQSGDSSGPADRLQPSSSGRDTADAPAPVQPRRCPLDAFHAMPSKRPRGSAAQPTDTQNAGIVQPVLYTFDLAAPLCCEVVQLLSQGTPGGPIVHSRLQTTRDSDYSHTEADSTSYGWRPGEETAEMLGLSSSCTTSACNHWDMCMKELPPGRALYCENAELSALLRCTPMGASSSSHGEAMKTLFTQLDLRQIAPGMPEHDTLVPVTEDILHKHPQIYCDRGLRATSSCDWLMGSKWSHTQAHTDAPGRFGSVIAVVAGGPKLVALWTKWHNPNIDLTQARMSNLGVPGRLQQLVREETKDGVVVMLRPGDALLVPAGVWHAAVNEDWCLSFNFSICTSRQLLNRLAAIWKWWHSEVLNDQKQFYARFDTGFLNLVEEEALQVAATATPAVKRDWRQCLARMYKHERVKGCDKAWLERMYKALGL